MDHTPIETARVYRWMNYLSGTLHAGGFGHFWRPERWSTSTDPASLEGVKDKALETISGAFQYIEDRLNGFHAVGDSFTAVDPFLYVFYRWGKIIGHDMSVYPKYSAFVQNLETRPAVKVTLGKEGLAPEF